MSGLGSSHYQVLGVSPEASMREIKQAYLAAARTAHPDVNHEPGEDRADTEGRMRRINEAWAVLGDVDQRAAYDRVRIRSERAGGERRATFHATVTGAHAFRPFDDGPDAGFDEADDRPITDSRLPDWLAILPVALLVAGLAGLVLGSILNFDAMVTSSLVLMISAGVVFLVAAPLLALGRAARGDRRP